MRARTKIILLIAAVALNLCSAPVEAQQAGSEDGRRRVLILNSYHKEFRWTDNQVVGAREVLNEAVGNLELYVEYMDTKRIYTEEYLDRLAQTYLLKYGHIQLEAIITTDDNALRFVVEHHEEIFQGVPVSFCGINDYPSFSLEGQEGFTGLVEVLDIEATLELALRLHPGTRKVFVVVDSTPTGIGQRREIAATERQFGDLEFEYLKGEDYSTTALIEKLRGLPHDSIVLLAVWLRDKNNDYVAADEVGFLISAASSAPVYGIIDMYLGYGIVGGKLLNSETHGRKAAEMAVRILKGEKPSDIPVLIGSSNPYMFDDSQLRRWGVDSADLPDGSVVVNRSFSLYETYRMQIWSIAAAFAFLVVVIAVLVVSIMRRRQAEEALRVSEKKHRGLTENLPQKIFQKDRNLVYVSCNKHYARDMGIAPDEIVGKTDFDFYPRELAEKYRADDRRLMEAGQTEDIEEPYIKEGQELFVHTVKTPLTDDSGNVTGILGIFWDNTERKLAAQERVANLRFLENMEWIDRVIVEATDVDQMMSNVLDVALAIFECDRAYLLYPCDPDAPSWRVPMERTRPEYPGAFAANAETRMTPDVAEDFRKLVTDGEPIVNKLNPGDADWDPEDTYSVRSSISMAIFPKIGKPWNFGLHHCSEAHDWTPADQRLFQEIGHRVSSALNALLYSRDLMESEEKHRLFVESFQGIAYQAEIESWKPHMFEGTIEEITGYSPDDFLSLVTRWNEIIHPEDVAKAHHEVEKLLSEHDHVADCEYRILHKSGEIRWVRDVGRVIQLGGRKLVQGTVVDITTRKRVEKELAATTAFLDTIVERSPFAMWVADPDGTVIRSNQSLRDTLNITDEKLLGKYNVLADKNLEPHDLVPTVKAVFEKHESARFVMPWKAAEAGDGDFEGALDRFVDVSLFPILNADGELVHVVCQWVDITDRKRAEQELVREQEFVEAAMASLPGIFYVYDEHGKFLRWNHNLETVSGYSADEIARMHPEEFFPPDDLPRVREAIGQAFSRGRAAVEARLLSKDGSERHHIFTGARFEMDGAPCLAGMGVDITDRKRAEEQLQEASEFRKKILSESPVGITIYEAESGRCVAANKSMGELVGATEEQLLAQNFREIKTWRPSGMLGAAEKALEENRKTQHDVNDMVTSFGRRIAIDSHFAPFVAGKDRYLLLTVSDITERKRAEREREITIDLLEFLNTKSDLRDLMKTVCSFMQIVSRCEAVGIRLRDGEDFPYYETRGFPHEFVEAERHLCVKDLDGQLQRDECGSPVLECMCGNILCGRFDPSKPFFTDHGSFVASSTSELLAAAAEVEDAHHARIRGRCVTEGYETVALIPLRSGGETFGLMQFNDRRKGNLSPEFVALAEHLCDSMAIALAQRQAEENLLAEKLLSEDYINSLPGLFYVFDEQRFVRWNNEWKRITGYSDEELGARYGTDFFEGEDRELIKERMLTVFDDGFADAEVDLVTKDGKRIPYYFTGVLKEFNGKPHLVGLGIDITDRKRAEAERGQLQEQLLARREREKELVEAELTNVREELVRKTRLATLGRLTATVSHELRNPLGTIRGSLFTIERAAEDKELGIGRALARAQRNIDRCDGIINELLDYTRTGVPETEPTNLDEWLAEVLDEQVIPEGITLDRSFQVGLQLPLDREKLRRCIVNLLTNACQAIQEKDPCEGRVAVETERRDDRIEVRVLDTGPGIEPDLLDKVFEPLYSTKGFGVGLGLSIVKQLIEAAGGGISITSTVGSGTNATLWLPPGGMEGEAKEPNDAES